MKLFTITSENRKIVSIGVCADDSSCFDLVRQAQFEHPKTRGQILSISMRDIAIEDCP